MKARFSPLPFLPSAAVPIPSAFMLAKRNARPCAPIIRMNDYAGGRRVLIRLVSVPADISPADDRG